MYSVKPGRGPSLIGGIGSIAVAIFGIIWTFGALSVGAPAFFALFGCVFVALAIAGAVYNFYNATGAERLSTFDITSDEEEGDPIAEALKPHASADQQGVGDQECRRVQGDFCPFCGTRLAESFSFCPKCGKRRRGADT